jgi:hypothetical protein
MKEYSIFENFAKQKIILGCTVAEQRVTGLELLDCVAGKGMETETRINLATSIHEWRRILYRSRNPDGRVCMGCMGNEDLSV